MQYLYIAKTTLQHVPKVDVMLILGGGLIIVTSMVVQQRQVDSNVVVQEEAAKNRRFIQNFNYFNSPLTKK